MGNFYDEWLKVGERIQEKMRQSPVVARDKDIPWVQTRQDAKGKLLVADEVGFPTMGGCLLKAEIPVGWHSGKHSHGEEAIHIIEGSGFSVVNDQRFEWRSGTTLHIPYRAVHQHFNTGQQPALYLSAMCFPIEAFVKLAEMRQFEDCGPNETRVLASIPAEGSQHYPDGARAALHLEDAPSRRDDPELGGNHYASTFLMENEGFPPEHRNGFQGKSAKITHIFEEPPGYHGGRHSHLEALLYVLDGEGYSEMEGVKVRWGPGDAVHVPPAMWEHEHYNDTPNTWRILRIEFPMRRWFTNMWPEGYQNKRSYDESGNPITWGKIERVRERYR